MMLCDRKLIRAVTNQLQCNTMCEYTVYYCKAVKTQQRDNVQRQATDCNCN